MTGFDEAPEERLFKAALAMAASEREAFIRRAADGDEELLEAVLLLVEGYEDEGGDLANETILEGSARRQWATSTEEPGTVIGPFTLVRKIGEGGMGSVWEAEQKKPIERRVALKLIKLGMDTAEVIARFERERQTLAAMEHSNIAHVLEAGATELGRPYFVMEFVDGEPITDFCQRQDHSVEQRLRLMQSVCSGIDHAHRRGIIHRDLKPSNILVNEKGEPKIIDFGIAKAAADEGGTMFTRESQMLGTPAYMSPEQASGKAQAIETRSDVYSLGVVLYELLAGAPPFDPARLESTGIAEMQKILTEENPPKPSNRRSTYANAQAPAGKSEPPTPNFEKDLDWIVLKSMAKEPERRYANATELADDLQRYLDGEVVKAVPPTIAYRVGKFAKRHKGPLLAAAAVLAAVAFGALLSNLLNKDKGFDPAGIVTPVAVKSNVGKDASLQFLIDGSGLHAIPRGTNARDLLHDFASSENSWATQQFKPDYFAHSDEIPVLDFQFEKPTEITGFLYWGYLSLRYGPDFGNEPKTFRFQFIDKDGNAIGDAIERRTEVPARRAARAIALPRTAGVQRVRLEILDNHFPFPDGSRVALGEVRFLSGEAPPQIFDPTDTGDPLPAVIAARLRLSGTETDQLIIDSISNDSLVAGNPPDFGDTALTFAGRPLSQYRGVLIPSAATDLWHNKIARVPGELNTAPEVFFDPPLPAGIWLNTRLPPLNTEVNTGELAFAYFPFSSGWAGGHIGGGGFQLSASHRLRMANAAGDFSIETQAKGHITLHDPIGDCVPEAGALFVVGTGYGSYPEVLGTFTEDESARPGWSIRVADAASAEPTHSGWSFVYLPYDTPNITVGRINAHGEPIAGGSSVDCEWQSQNQRYHLHLKGHSDLSRGALIINSCESASTATSPLPAQFYWELAEKGDAFYLYPQPLPMTEDEIPRHPHGFVFAYVPFGAEFDVESLAAAAAVQLKQRQERLADIPADPAQSLVPASSDGVIGFEPFDYEDGLLPGKRGGRHWNWNHAKRNQDGIRSDWDPGYWNPQSGVSSRRLRTTGGGTVIRSFHAPSAEDQPPGGHPGAVRGTGKVYFRVELTRDANVEWCGISSMEANIERVFFGMGGTEFEVKEAFKSGASSGIVPEPGRTYTMVAKLDFEDDVIALWLDPDFTKEESANQPAAIMPYHHSYWSTAIRLGSGGEGFTTWDNLIVADYWNGLTLVPAPGSQSE